MLSPHCHCGPQKDLQTRVWAGNIHEHPKSDIHWPTTSPCATHQHSHLKPNCGFSLSTESHVATCDNTCMNHTGRIWVFLPHRARVRAAARSSRCPPTGRSAPCTPPWERSPSTHRLWSVARSFDANTQPAGDRENTVKSPTQQFKFTITGSWVTFCCPSSKWFLWFHWRK